MPEKVNKGAAPVHVRINSPNWSRRELLSLAIDLVRMQKLHRDYLRTKKFKEDLMKRLRRNAAEVKELMKVLDSYELPMSLTELEELPQFKRQKEAIRKMESVRQAAERKINAFEEELDNLASLKPKAVPKSAKDFERKQNLPPKPSKSEVKKPVVEKKPVDKLEADMENLKRRLESL